MSDKYLLKLKSLTTIPDADLRNKAMLEVADKFETTFQKVEEDFTKAWLEELDNRIKVIERDDLDYAAKLLKKEAVNNWLKQFISDKKDRENLINSKLIKDEPVKIYTLANLKELRKRNRSKYYITGLFQSGLYLAVAQAKTGKSLFGYSIAVSLLRGQKFLNRKTVNCNVLIIQNEEELGSTGQKIDNNGLQEFERENPEEYNELINSHKLIVVKGLDISVDRQKILDIIDEYDISCLIVDSFRASIGKGGLTEYDIGAATALYQLQSAIHERSMLCLVIHHANKSDSNSGKTAAFNGVGGHNALAGANDGVIKLMRNADKKFDGNETIDIHFYPRNDNPCSFNIVYREGEACRWSFDVLDESTLSDAMVTNICTILMELDAPYREWLSTDVDERDEVPPGKSIGQLIEATGLEKQLLVKTLNYLDHNESVCRYAKNRQWIYHIPPEGSDLFYLVEEAERRSEETKKMAELLQSIYANILKLQTIEELDSFRESLDEEVRELVRDRAPEEVHRHISMLRKPPKFAIGDKVVFANAEKKVVHTVEEVVFKGVGSNTDAHRWQYRLKGLPDLIDTFELNLAQDSPDIEF